MSRYIDADALKDRLQNLAYDDWNLGAATTWAGAFSVAADMVDDAPTADVVEIKKEGEWEMFDLISSAYYGKGMFFKQDDGTVYSRYSCKYMSVDEAIREFVSLIDDSELVERRYDVDTAN